MKKVLLITFGCLLAVYLAVLLLLGLQPRHEPGVPHTSEGGKIMFALDVPKSEILRACAERMKAKYGARMTVEASDTMLTYTVAIPSRDGYDDATDTITLEDYAPLGQAGCQLTHRLAVTKRYPRLAFAPLHFLCHLTANGYKDSPVSKDIVAFITSSNRVAPTDP